MNKNFLFYTTLLILLLLPGLYLMFRTPIYFGYDVLVHIERIRQFHLAIANGQIPPRLAPGIVYGNGYPLFIVNYQLPYFIAEIFMIIKNDPTLAFKAVMSSTYLLSGVFIFFLFRTYGSNLASLTGAVIFSYIPYRFGNLYFRGAIGESVAFLFVPLILLSMQRLCKGKRLSVPLLSLSVFGVITSHSLIFLIFSPLFALYLFLFLKPNWQKLFLIIASVIWGIVLSAFQLLPSIFEKKYLKFDQTLLDIYKGQFVNFFQLYRIPGTGVNLGAFFQAGIISAFIIFLSIIILVISPSRYLLIFLAFIIVSTFLITKQSLWLWDHFPLLSYVIYPWRFISIIILCVAFLSSYLVDFIKTESLKKIFAFFVIFLSIFTARHYFLNSGHKEALLPKSTLTAFDESDPIWSNSQTFMNGPLIKTEPEGRISNVDEKPLAISFAIDTKAPSSIIIRRMYFPGWEVAINGKKYPLDQKNGFLKTQVEAGDWQIKASFGETSLRKSADIISLTAFLALIFLITIPLLKRF